MENRVIQHGLFIVSQHLKLMWVNENSKPQLFPTSVKSLLLSMGFIDEIGDALEDENYAAILISAITSGTTVFRF